VIGVTINLTRLDFFIAQCRMQARHPVNVGAWLLIGGWLAYLGMRGAHVSAATLALAVGIGLLMCAAFFAGVVVVVSAVMALLASAERAVLGEHTFRITGAGLVESTRANEHLVRWGGARALLRTRRYLYVRVTFGQFHVIPRRHFADAAADDEFWNALQPLVSKTKS
jgi:hypothetical protein